MSERNVLSACIVSRAAYDTICDRFSEGDLTEQGNTVLRAIGEYYESDPSAQRVDPELLTAAIQRTLSSPKHKQGFARLVSELAANDSVSPQNIVRDFLATKRATSGSRLAAALAMGRDPSDVQPLIDDYQQWCTAELPPDALSGRAVLRGASITDLVSEHYADGKLIQVFPRALNDRLAGGVLRGHHIVLFAVPEAGKTLVSMNMAYGFLKQGLVVLYVGNEDPVQDLVIRSVCRLADRDAGGVLSDPEGAEREARKHGYENLVLASLSPGTVREIESLIVEHKPDVVIVDQIRNLYVGKDDPVQQLDAAAKAMRTLGKRHGVVMVSVTQAADSATGKAVLEQNDVFYSNTAVSATADVMVGVGGTHEDFAANRRVLSLPKNKRSGDHSWFPVVIDPQRNKVRSI